MCKSSITKKNGIRKGVQLYKCQNCGYQFTGKEKVSASEIWEDYHSGKQTIKELSLKYGVSESTIKRRLRTIHIQWQQPHYLGHGVIHLDATYFGRNVGIMLAIESGTGDVLYMEHIKHERVADYLAAVDHIEKSGYHIDGIVIDGMHALFSAFSKYKIQMCQFHMVAIIRRKLTKNPQLQSGTELLDLMYSMKNDSKSSFIAQYKSWCDRWKDFLSEKTINEVTGRKFFTHQRLRSAKFSIDFYLPYLFTYEQVEGMPRTNNKIEGRFTDLKKNINVHSGMSDENRKRFINEFFLA